MEDGGERERRVLSGENPDADVREGEQAGRHDRVEHELLARDLDGAVVVHEARHEECSEANTGPDKSGHTEPLPSLAVRNNPERRSVVILYC